MAERSSPISNKMVLRLSWFVLMALLLGPVLSYSAAAKLQRRPRTTDQVLSRIRKAHILGKIPTNVFNSFLLSGCMRIDQSLIPKTAPKRESVNCINEETGVLYPSLAYVSVAIGPTRVTELVDIEQGKGWHIIDPATFSVSNPRNISVLQKMKYDALSENAQHSLPALLAALQSSEQLDKTEFSVTSDANGIVLKWQKEPSTNEFFFNPHTFLCEKQVRTIGTDKSVMKYSNYKRVGNVMLPHTIVAAKGDGTTMAIRDIRKWELAKQWPKDHFHPETIRVFR